MFDVTLRRNGVTRRWNISTWAGRWSYCYTEGHSISFTGCHTLDVALAKKVEWEAEIAAAKADGWALIISKLQDTTPH